MTGLAARVLRTVRAHGLVSLGDRVAVAVSGGPDSVALLHLLREIAVSGGFTIAGLVHVNHQLRRGEADADEQFCRSLAAALSLPIEATSVRIGELARERRISLERAGHEARYECYERARQALDAGLVATGHTKSDQAETLLLRLLRGAGARGLGAIHPRVGHVIRPLLDIARADVERYLGERRIEYRTDASNLDRAIPRNRIRHELLPLLERDFAPGIVETLARTALLAREDAELLDRLAAVEASRVVRSTGEGIHILPAVANLPPAVARRVVRRAFADRWPGRELGFEHVDSVLRLLATSDRHHGVDVPGFRVLGSGEGLLAVPAQGPRRRQRGWWHGLLSESGPLESPLVADLPVPGELELAAAGGVLSARIDMSTEPADVKRYVGRGREDVAAGMSAALDAAMLTAPLRVRFRRPGDRLRPLGQVGHRKLQDLFVDRKVARDQRDRVPLVVDGEDRIAWVVGYAIAEDFRVSPRTTSVLLLNFRPSGGSV